MTVFDRFGDYMVSLLSKPLQEIRQLCIFLQVIGRRFDAVKAAINLVRTEGNIMSAKSLSVLKLHGKDRQMEQLFGESMEDYRIRLTSKAIISAQAGTRLGVISAVQSLGFTDVDVQPLYKSDANRWAEFLVIISQDLNDVKDVTLEHIYYVVRKAKRASALDNYRFGYVAQAVDIPTSAAIQLTVYSHFDGTFYLDGSRMLNGLESDGEVIMVRFELKRYKEKMAKALAGIRTMPLMERVAFGSGAEFSEDGEPVLPGAEETTLKNELLRTTITSRQVDGTVCEYICTVPYGQLIGSKINEIALIDSDGDVAELIRFKSIEKSANEMQFSIRKEVK